MKNLVTVIILFLFTFTTFASVTVTPASGGTGLRPTSSNVSGGWALLGDIVITEGEMDDIPNSQHGVQLILTAPFNWLFNLTQASVATTGGDDITAISIAGIGSVIAVTFSTDNGSAGRNSIDEITISGIQVQPILPLPPSLGAIFRTSGNPGDATIFDIIEGGTSFGILSLDSDDPLPVELKSFSAKIIAKSVNLEWTTATEVNNYGFEILRSTQDDKWDVLGFVEGHGNSNSPKEYNFIDSEVNPAGTYSYRLKQIDNDGSYEFSKTIEVSFDSPISLELSQNYPNPFNPSTTINFSLPQSGNVTLKIFNPLGEEVITLTDGYIEAGIYTFNFNGEGLPSGIYIYQLSTPEKTQTMKMILMK